MYFFYIVSSKVWECLELWFTLTVVNVRHVKTSCVVYAHIHMFSCIHTLAQVYGESHKAKTQTRRVRMAISLYAHKLAEWQSYEKERFFWFQSKKEIYIYKLASTNTQHWHKFTSQNVNKEVTCFDHCVYCEAWGRASCLYAVGTNCVEGTHAVGSKSRGQTGKVYKLTLKLLEAWQTVHVLTTKGLVARKNLQRCTEMFARLHGFCIYPITYIIFPVKLELMDLLNWWTYEYF